VRFPGKSVLGKPFAAAMAEWERMAPRERRVVMALGALVAAALMMVAVVFVVQEISARAEYNDEVREALAAIAKNRDDYLDAKARSAAQEARVLSEAPPTDSDLEAAASGVGLVIPEQSSRPPLALGKRFIQHDVDMKLRQVDLLQLSKFLKQVETGPHLIITTRLLIRRDFSSQEKISAEITATAFERVKESAKKKPTGKTKNKADEEADKSEEEGL